MRTALTVGRSGDIGDAGTPQLWTNPPAEALVHRSWLRRLASEAGMWFGPGVGDEVSASRFSREERQRYREKVQLCLDVFERLITTWRFEDDKPLTGLEIELNLVDAEYQPALVNAAVLDEISDPNYQTELGAYNIELNVAPNPLAALADLEGTLRASLNAAETKANARDAHIVMVGILPTLMQSTWPRTVG
jgi:hypothetical protein